MPIVIRKCTTILYRVLIHIRETHKERFSESSHDEWPEIVSARRDTES